MSTRTLDDRREALEESFFRKQNEELLATLREKKAHQEQRDALAREMACEDDALLDQLIDVGLRAETWLALSLVPLVEVAWADREITAAEREKVLEAAVEHHIQVGSEPYRLLEQWLIERPPPALAEAWKAYVQIVGPTLSADERRWIHRDVLERARDVARATNSLLGIGVRVSDAETQVLHAFEEVLSSS